MDPGFGDHGVAVADLSAPGSATYYGWAAARNPATGDIVVAAGIVGPEAHEQWAVMRFRADGTPDPAFGSLGVVRTDFQGFDADSDHPVAVAFDTSGPAAQHRILVAGYATVADAVGVVAQRLAVVAYLPDGSRDPSFATSGTFLLSGNWSAQAVAVRATAGGEVVVAGVRDGEPIALRLLSDGSLDPTYGTGGIAGVSGNGASLVAAAVQADGGVVFGLQGVTWDPVFAYEATLVRLSPGGAPDAGFGTGGAVVRPNEQLAGLLARADGSLVALHPAVTWGDPSRLRVYGANGSPVGSDTVLSAAFATSSMDAAMDGSVVLGGTMSPDWALFAIARITPGGGLDATFDGDGYAWLDLGGYQSNTHALALPGGAVAVAGTRNDPVTGATSFVVARVDGAGAEDTTFGNGAGFGAIAATASSIDSGQDIAVHQADGKLVVLARTYGSNATTVLRYLPDGTPDPGFGTAGVRALQEPALATLAGTGIALQANGRIVVTGLRFTWLTAAPWIRYEIVAVGLLNDGALDPAFDGDGVAAIVLDGSAYSTGGGIAVQADDRIVACTTSYRVFPDAEMTVVRFQPDGSVDASFGGAGLAYLGTAGSSTSATSVAVAPDGRIAVAGTVETYSPGYGASVALAWLSPTGSLLEGPSTGVAGFGVDVAIDGTGRAVLAAQRFWGTPVYDGNWNLVGVTGASPWPETAFAALRVMPDGDLDPGFGTGGVAVAPVPTADHAYATAVALQPDGCIVLAGSATLQPAPGTWRNDFVVLRLLAGGAADASFADDGAASADVGPYDDARSVLLQGDGKIVVVGTALAYGASFQQKSDVAVVRLLGVSSPHVLVHALQEIVRAMAAQQLLNQGQAKALIAKLQAALHQIDNGNPGPATMQLLAFRNQVLAFGQAEVLSPADTTVLQAAADGIAALLAP